MLPPPPLLTFNIPPIDLKLSSGGEVKTRKQTSFSEDATSLLLESI